MKILLSIKPEYVDKILDGSKKYEFRKRIHRNSQVRTVIMYATKPIGKVVGEFSIKKVHSERPDALWDKTKEHSGVSEDFFLDYFCGKEIGYAIEVAKVKRYKKPKELSEFLNSGVAPQSYAYLSS